MPDILLKNAMGEDVRYNGVEEVLLTHADTGEKVAYMYSDGPAAVTEALVDKTPASTVRVESQCQRLRDYAFYQCGGVLSVALPEAVNLGLQPFYGADNLEYVSAPKALSVPPNGFFYCGKLREVELPGVTSLGDYAFDGCFALERVQFGPLTAIGKYALRDTAVAELVLTGDTVCTLGTAALYYTPIDAGEGYIYVPEALVEAYKSDSGWSRYADSIRGMGS